VLNLALGGGILLECRHSAGLRSTDVMEDPGQVEIRASARWVGIYSTVYVRIYKGIQLESKLQHTATRPSSAHPPRRLCYRPSVFFFQLRLTALSFLQGTFRVALKKILFFFLLLIFEICVTLKLPNMRLRKLGVFRVSRVSRDHGQINGDLSDCFGKARSWIQEGYSVSRW
jgi:hypothetical protein